MRPSAWAFVYLCMLGLFAFVAWARAPFLVWVWMAALCGCAQTGLESSLEIYRSRRP